MTVSVAPGQAAVPMQAGQGSALCWWDAAEVVTLAAAPASGQSRIDRIVAQVRDNALDSGGNNDFLITNVTGTAATTGSQVAPAVPTNAYALANVLVPGNVTNLNTATVTMVGTPLLPQAAAYVDVASTAPPANTPTITPPEGLLWIDTSTNPIITTVQLPPPVTTGSTIQTYTDANGDIWVAKNGVRSGNWYRARDVLYARLSRGAVYTFPTAATNMAWDQFDDPYGIWTQASQQMTIPLAGLWSFNGSNYTPFAGLSTGPQNLGSNLVQNGTVVSRGSQATNWANSPVRSPLSDVLRCVAGDVIAYTVQCSLASQTSVYADKSNNWLAINYLGTG
jgi:hypothetical protein